MIHRECMLIHRLCMLHWLACASFAYLVTKGSLGWFRKIILRYEILMCYELFYWLMERIDFDQQHSSSKVPLLKRNLLYVATVVCQFICLKNRHPHFLLPFPGRSQTPPLNGPLPAAISHPIWIWRRKSDGLFGTSVWSGGSIAQPYLLVPQPEGEIGKKNQSFIWPKKP